MTTFLISRIIDAPFAGQPEAQRAAGEDDCMADRLRHIAIVCQPWDEVGAAPGSSIPIIVYELGRRLARHYRVTVYGRRGQGQRRRDADDSGVEFRRLSVLRKPWAVLETLAGILGCYFDRRIDLLFRFFYHWLYVLRVALDVRTSRADVIIVVNFVQFASIIKIVNPSAVVALHMQCAWLTQFASTSTLRRLRKIDQVFGCSDYITEAVKKRFPEIASRCHTIYNGVDLDHFRPAPLPIDGVKRLLFVGRLSPEKGTHTLIDAFQIVVQNHPNIELHLVGEAFLLKYLYLSPTVEREDRTTAGLAVFYGSGFKDMVRRQLLVRARSYSDLLRAKANGDKRIFFHGPVSQVKTLAYYQAAAMLVFPSVWNEPFGMPTVEGSACCVPIVATMSGGIPEIVDDGRSGVLVKRGDAGELARAIERVLNMPAETALAMGQAGRHRAVDRFSWDLIAARLAQFVEEAARRRSVKVPAFSPAAR
jgi:glycosyltransferase involved in cell wall biosynthesis